MKFRSLKPGTLLFGRFEVLCLLGEGGVSHVYKCRDHARLGKKIALKVLLEPASKDAQILKRFVSEVEIVNSLKSPYIIKHAELFKSENYIAYSMDYVAGVSLATKISKPGKLSIAEVLNILMQICRAVETIHKAKFIHRDLKPENMLVTDRGQLKLIDFGIAIPEKNLGTSNEGISGTMNYASPEYIEFGIIDRRSDIYAIGAIAYELITGEAAFCYPDPLETMKAKVRRDVPSPKLSRTDCPAALAALTTKAMARQVENRYQEIGQLINDLKAIQNTLGFDTSERIGSLKQAETYTKQISNRNAISKQIQLFLAGR